MADDLKKNWFSSSLFPWGSDFFISVNNGRKEKTKQVDNILFLSYYKCPF